MHRAKSSSQRLRAVVEDLIKLPLNKKPVRRFAEQAKGQHEIYNVLNQHSGGHPPEAVQMVPNSVRAMALFVYKIMRR